jgi:hypothetical protein
MANGHMIVGQKDAKLGTLFQTLATVLLLGVAASIRTRTVVPFPTADSIWRVAPTRARAPASRSGRTLVAPCPRQADRIRHIVFDQ